jgi:hypothetical protein
MIAQLQHPHHPPSRLMAVRAVLQIARNPFQKTWLLCVGAERLATPSPLSFAE